MLRKIINLQQTIFYQIKKNICFVCFPFLVLGRNFSYFIRFFFGSLLHFKFPSSEKLKMRYSKQNIKKILLFRTDRLGDSVLTLPAIEVLKRNFPHAEIDIVARPYTKEIFKLSPFINKILIKDKNISNLIQTIKDNHYDMAIIFFANIEDAKIALKSKIPIRLGSNRAGIGYLLTHYIKDSRQNLRHEVNACIDILKPLNIPIKKYSLNMTPQTYSRVDQFIKNAGITKKQKLVIIHPFSRDPLMRWPEKYYKHLTSLFLQEKNTKVIILGGPNEKTIADKFIETIKHPNLINGANLFSLEELIYLLKRASLFIGNSTGTMHIANAVQTPVVSFFGSRYIRHHYKRWYPWNKQNSIYFKAPQLCKTCYPWCCKMECFYKVTPQKVFINIKNNLKYN